MLTFLNKYRNFGLLLLRIGIGCMFVMHGGPKMFAGPEKWVKLGMAMGNVGVHYIPVFWGFMAAFSELFGGICLILGVFFRPACILLALTMGVATSMHLAKGGGLMGSSHSIEAGILFLSLIFIGPGKFSFDEKLHPQS